MPKNWTVSDALKQKLTALVLEDIATPHMEVRDKGNGQYATTGQQTIAIDDLGDIPAVGDLDLAGGCARFSFSLTAYPAERRAKGKAESNEQSTDRTFKLKASEIVEIDSLVAQATEAADVPLAVRLNTIKALNGRGLVSMQDMIFLDGVIKAADARKEAAAQK